MSTKKILPVTAPEPTSTAANDVAPAIADASTAVLVTDAAAATDRETAFFTVPLAPGHNDAETVALSSNDFAVAGMGPRTRWAAIIWGVVFAVIAAGALTLVVYPANRDDFADWLFALAPTTMLLLLALTVGTLLLLLGLIGLLRRSQRARAQRRTSHVE